VKNPEKMLHELTALAAAQHTVAAAAAVISG